VLGVDVAFRFAGLVIVFEFWVVLFVYCGFECFLIVL